MSDYLKCKVDSKEYKYCPTCPKDKNKPSWYTMFCCENCKNIFETLTKYYLKKITKDEAKAILITLDLSKKNTFDEDMQTQIEEILGGSIVSRACVSEKIEEESVEEVKSEAAETVPVAKKILGRRKK